MFDLQRSMLWQFAAVTAVLAAVTPAMAIVQADYDENAAKQPREGVMRRAVMLRYTPLQVFGGSAVLVAPDVALTAAHGAKGWPASQLTIDLNGAFKLKNAPAKQAGGDKKSIRIGVRQVLLHPDPKVDLAVLKLSQTVAVEPARLLDRAPKVGERIWLGGYGVYGSPGKPKGFGVFHAGFNRVASVRSGRAKVVLDKTPPETDGTEPDVLPAAFDSGSPVWVETPDGWALSGVTVTASGREGPNFGDRSHHQLLAPVREWLDGVLSASRENPPAAP